MAKTSTAQKRPTPPPRGGRPAGLFTWIAVGLVVVVVAALVIIKVAGGGSTNNNGKTSFQATDATTASQLTTVPASVFDTVGVTSPIAQVSPPQQKKGLPMLWATNADGKKVPQIFYIGAEFCPYCAAQRWATIIALSRFGTWSGLGNMSSYSGDYAPNTPTFTFVKATYTSRYIVFKSVEQYADYIDPTTKYYATLQTPTTAEADLVKKYDQPKYISGMTASEAQSIPFLSFANQFLAAGASYSPTTLAGSTRSDIAAGLANADSPVTEAIITSANYQTAAICSLTKDQPSNVCTSSGVKAADKVMGLT